MVGWNPKTGNHTPPDEAYAKEQIDLAAYVPSDALKHLQALQVGGPRAKAA